MKSEFFLWKYALIKFSASPTVENLESSTKLFHLDVSEMSRVGVNMDICAPRKRSGRLPADNRRWMSPVHYALKFLMRFYRWDFHSHEVFPSEPSPYLMRDAFH